MDWYLLVWKKFAEFSGRSRRKEYWMFTLFHTIICLILFIGVFALGKSGTFAWVLICAYSLAAIVPSLAVTVRRLHDTGKSAWWLLLSFVPLGGLVLLVFTCLDSDPGPNLYGPSPKELVLSGVSS